MMAILRLGDGTEIPLSRSSLEYWDWHLLPFGAIILCDFRRWEKKP